MGYVGRKLRERRILFPESQRGLIVPVDHGLTLGPIAGMQATDDFEGWIGTDHISAVLGHKGLIERLILRDMLHPSTGVIVHLNGMANLSSDGDTKVMVSNVEAALRLGADAVSIQVNFTADNFAHNFTMLGAVTDAAHAAGLPVLTMLYDKVKSPTPAERIARLSHLVRVVAELGSDAVKLAFPEFESEVPALVARHSRDIRIFFAGGDKASEESLVAMTRAAILSGASGLCIGRNVFQHPRPLALLERLSACVKGEVELAEELDAV
ncbi:class I fructose-bisphosphate aldolase [Trinickia fusca]|uniref:Aldolase n=1 Tax=Trinickia fusca TaxID=2419777 RepID=A0A494X6I8_9BURK|nr:aldolase [Trinickia fusca]RKP46030.1 aldolase [Trinickia fusca]